MRTGEENPGDVGRGKSWRGETRLDGGTALPHTETQPEIIFLSVEDKALGWAPLPAHITGNTALCVPLKNKLHTDHSFCYLGPI